MRIVLNLQTRVSIPGVMACLRFNPRSSKLQSLDPFFRFTVLESGRMVCMNEPNVDATLLNVCQKKKRPPRLLSARVAAQLRPLTNAFRIA